MSFAAVSRIVAAGDAPGEPNWGMAGLDALLLRNRPPGKRRLGSIALRR
jgi:hypothetical protein